MVGKACLPRLKSQIDTLSSQMDDVLLSLSMPERKPGLHSKLVSLLHRLHDERARLDAVLVEAREQGVDALGWGELAAKIARPTEF